MVCEINYGVMKFSELLFGQIAARLIITFNVTLAREQWKSRGKTSTNFRFHHASVLISLYYYWNVIDTKPELSRTLSWKMNKLSLSW